MANKLALSFHLTYWFFLSVASVRSSDINCTVSIEQGSLEGLPMASLFGRSACAYKGIPYAQPPIDELRFKAPKAATNWEGTLNATQMSKLCIGMQLNKNEPEMDEDCLYLNIYTPKFDEKYTWITKYPVLVFIPDDGFLGDQSYLYGPDYFMDNEVVLVTINYRVGALGFLSTGSPYVVGNNGLKDQVRALRWVQKNIAAFGGNPESVTIYGHGVGAACVHYHILSPMSKGLFHRAISQSGSAFNPNMKPELDPRGLAEKLGKMKDCPTDKDSRLLNCLEALNQTEFANISSLYFAPVVESNNSKEEKFLPYHPLDIIKNSGMNKVPWLIGTVNNEGAFLATELLLNKSAVYAWNDNSEDIVITPHILRLLDDKQLLDKHWTKILNFYLGEDTHMISNDTIVPLMQLYSDRIYNFGIYTSVVLHALSGHTEIFKYNFAFNGTSHYNKFPKYLRQYIGASHGDDLLYLFKLPMLETFPPGQPEIDIIMKMTRIFSDFAKNGNPSAFNITWNPVGYVDKRNINLRYMDITSANPKSFDGLNLTMKQNLHKDRMEFWLTLPLSENSFFSNFTNSALPLVPLPIIITMTFMIWIVNYYCC